MRLGVRDELVPQHVAERGAHLLGDAREQRAPPLLCALARHPHQCTRGGRQVRPETVMRHLQAAVVPGGGSLEEKLESGTALGVGEGTFGIDVEVVVLQLKFGQHRIARP